MAMLVGCGGGSGGAASTPDPQSEEDKTVYALGYLIGERAKSANLTPEEAAIAARGFYDAAVQEEGKVDLQKYSKEAMAFNRKRIAERTAKEKEKSKPFIEAAAKEEGAEVLPSGLVFRTLVEGTGASPTQGDVVRVHYRGSLADGTEFDSSYAKGKPADISLNRVVRCWQEGIPKMKVGGKARLVCPSDIGYGDRGSRNIPGGAALNFEVELLEIVGPAPTGGARLPTRITVPPRPAKKP